MQNRQKEITPALRDDLTRLRDCLLELASKTDDDPVGNAQKMELLCSILQEAGLVERKEDVARFTDLRTAVREVEQLIGIDHEKNSFLNRNDIKPHPLP